MQYTYVRISRALREQSFRGEINTVHFIEIRNIQS